MAGSQGSSQWSSVQLLCPAVVVVHPECVTITTSILSFWLINLHFTRTNAGVLKVMTNIQHEIPGHSKPSLSQASQYFTRLCFPTLLASMHFIGTPLFFSLFFFLPHNPLNWILFISLEPITTFTIFALQYQILLSPQLILSYGTPH